MVCTRECTRFVHGMDAECPNDMLTQHEGRCWKLLGSRQEFAEQIIQCLPNVLVGAMAVLGLCATARTVTCTLLGMSATCSSNAPPCSLFGTDMLPCLGPVSSLSANLFGIWMSWPLRTLSWTALTSCIHLTMTCRMIHLISPRWLEQM